MNVDTFLCMSLYNENTINSSDSNSKMLYNSKDYEAWSWIMPWFLQIECVTRCIWFDVEGNWLDLILNQMEIWNKNPYSKLEK